MKTFDLDIFQLIILLGSIQGLIFASIIFIKRQLRMKSNIFLGLMIVCIAISNIQHILIDVNYLDEDNFIRKLYLPIQWFIMPMFYLHVHELFLRKKLPTISRYTLFAPVLLVFTVHIVHFIIRYNSVAISQMPDYYTPGLLLYTNLISFIFNGLIFYLIYHLLIEIKKSITKTLSRKAKELEWYTMIIRGFVIIATLGLIITFFVSIFDINHNLITYTFLLLVSVVGYYLGYVAVYKSITQPKVERVKTPITRTGQNTLEKIISYIEEEKHYLNPDISLTEIATHFNISSGYLSQLFNARGDQNFNDYINELRINASKKMLLEDQFNNYTIESIGIECGFKSKSNFYTSFKKFTGKTPKNYANQC